MWCENLSSPALRALMRRLWLVYSQVNEILAKSSVWSAFKDQKHDLFISESQTAGYLTGKGWKRPHFAAIFPYQTKLLISFSVNTKLVSTFFPRAVFPNLKCYALTFKPPCGWCRTWTQTQQSSLFLRPPISWLCPSLSVCPPHVLLRGFHSFSPGRQQPSARRALDS